MRSLISFLIFASLLGSVDAAGPSARIAGSPARVDYLRRESGLLLHVEQAAAALGWQAKLVRPGKLLTFCRAEPSGVCVPLQLGGVQRVEDSGAVFLDARALAEALRFTIDESQGQVTLLPGKPGPPQSKLPAYNAAWGAGRGFRTGQTLPDIPLYNMDGSEVRFSTFLGRQYIIYCWASW